MLYHRHGHSLPKYVHFVFTFFGAFVFLLSIQQDVVEAKQLELSNGKLIKNVSEIPGELKEDELSSFGLIVGKSNLNDVKKVLGGDIIGNSGKGPNEVSYLCFLDKSGNVLAYESSRAMGGPDLTITSTFILASGEKYTFKKECKKSAKQFGAIEIGSGLKIGTSIENVRKIKGIASHTSKSEIIYLYGNSKRQSEGFSERMDLLEIGISAKRVSSIVVTRVGD